MRLTKRARGLLARRGQLKLTFAFHGTTMGEDPVAFSFSRRLTLVR